MFRVTIQKYYRDQNYFMGYDYDNPIRIHIERDKLSECMDDVLFERMQNDVAKFTPWEITDVEDLSEEKGA